MFPRSESRSHARRASILSLSAFLALSGGMDAPQAMACASSISTLGASFSSNNAFTAPIGAHFLLARSAAPKKTLNDPDPVAAAVLLERTGLTAANLAAAGVSADQADSIALQMLVYTMRDEVLPDLHSATEALNQAANTSAPADDGVVHASVAELQLSLDQLLVAARDFALTGLNDAGTRGLIETIILTSAQWADIPASYRTIDRGDDEYIMLRGALSARRYADQSGTTLADAPAQVLGDADSDILVSASQMASEANFDAIVNAINQRLQ